MHELHIYSRLFVMTGAYAVAVVAMAAPVLTQLKPSEVGHLATCLTKHIVISKRLAIFFGYL